MKLRTTYATPARVLRWQQRRRWTWTSVRFRRLPWPCKSAQGPCFKLSQKERAMGQDANFILLSCITIEFAYVPFRVAS
jgi:hypothetical protein